MRFLDNVLQDFIDRAPPEMANAVYAAKRERSVGLGLMGFHSFLQAPERAVRERAGEELEHAPLQDPAPPVRRGLAHAGRRARALPGRRRARRDGALLATSWRSRRPPRSRSSAAAPAPASSRSRPTSTRHKTLSGSFAVKNPYLERLLDAEGPEHRRPSGTRSWRTRARCSTSTSSARTRRTSTRPPSRSTSAGSSNWPPTARRTICQSQSVNIFLPGDVDKWDLHMLHWQAWERGCKSLYYLRSKSVQRAAPRRRRDAARRSTCRARPRPTTRNASPASRRRRLRRRSTRRRSEAQTLSRRPIIVTAAQVIAWTVEIQSSRRSVRRPRLGCLVRGTAVRVATFAMS